MHGYQLSEFMENHLALFFDIKKATAYNLLGKMEDKGWVSSREEQEGKRPPRRVFAITPEGETLFQELLREALPEYRRAAFPGNVPILFMDALPPEELEDLLEQRRDSHPGTNRGSGNSSGPCGPPPLRSPTDDSQSRDDLVGRPPGRTWREMKIVWTVLIVGAISAVALWVWPGVLVPNAGIDNQPTSYRTATITRRDIQSTVLATGVIRPMVGAEVQVGSRVSGVLQTLNVSIGDDVVANEILARLDQTEFQARFDQAVAARETAAGRGTVRRHRLWSGRGNSKTGRS